MKKMLLILFFTATILTSINGMAFYLPDKKQDINSLGLSLQGGSRSYCASLSYIYGTYDYQANYLQADIGYSLIKNSIEARLGVTSILLFFGIEGGIIYSHSTIDNNNFFDDEEKYALGIYTGIIPIVVVASGNVISFSLGGIFYKGSNNNEFYLRFTTTFI